MLVNKFQGVEKKPECGQWILDIEHPGVQLLVKNEIELCNPEFEPGKNFFDMEAEADNMNKHGIPGESFQKLSWMTFAEF